MWEAADGMKGVVSTSRQDGEVSMEEDDGAYWVVVDRCGGEGGRERKRKGEHVDQSWDSIA